ncbi:MAG: hypothetical protein HY851_11095 [candidate division Zixibacteria bacterium]|nr:hypothetical protein [candidate division Zixibacteria bacterium]
MESGRNKTLHLIIGTVVAVAAPLAIYPRLFEQDLLRASWQYIPYEIALYGLVGAVAYRCTNLVSILNVVGLSLAYRLAIGALLGVLIAVVYSTEIGLAIPLAEVSYWPGLVLQVILTPLALMPVLREFGVRPSAPRREPGRVPISPPVRTQFPATPARERTEPSHLAPKPREVSFPEATAAHARIPVDNAVPSIPSDLNGFDRAVRYVAEHGSVYFVAVVDHEGLLLANHCRGRLDPEDLAPLAVTFLEWNRQILAKGKFGEVEKIDILLKEKRLVLGRIGTWCMMTLAERLADDLLNIRINQGLDMLKKHWLERNGSNRQNEVEKAYV